MLKTKGFYGQFGGQFVPETLIPALDELEHSFNSLKESQPFIEELNTLLNTYAGRPTPVYYGENISRKYGIEMFFKREDLLHTGAHKINNTLGQCLLAKHMGKSRIIAETGAGQHGVATATAAALLNMECRVYMGKKDAVRQKPNLEKMGILGAEVVEVEDGSQTLKDATNAALRDYVRNVEHTHYVIGSVVGPYPFPEIVAHFQSVIGKEARSFFESKGFPDVIVASVGGGSNAIGIFREFVSFPEIKLVGVEAGGISDEDGKHARTMGLGRPGILHGCLTQLIQDENHQVKDVHSVSAGLDYPGVGPEHAFLDQINRVDYHYVRDHEVLNAVKEMASLEGIIPALESSHAIAWVLNNSESLRGKKVLINLSGRGDKDMSTIRSQLLKETHHKDTKSQSEEI